MIIIPFFFLHIQLDVRANSSPTQEDSTEKANEFIAAKHEREFSVFNIASVCATDSRVKVSSERM